MPKLNPPGCEEVGSDEDGEESTPGKGPAGTKPQRPETPSEHCPIPSMELAPETGRRGVLARAGRAVLIVCITASSVK